MSDRAVFDCMIFLQGAMRETSPAAACFRLVDRDLVALCLSPEVLAEIKEVLARPSLQRKYKELAPDRVEKMLSAVERKAVVTTAILEVFSYPRDPKDEKYVNLALAAGARYLVSRDKDLLDLVQDADFRQRFSELIILDPIRFLHLFPQPPEQEQAAYPKPEETP